MFRLSGTFGIRSCSPQRGDPQVALGSPTNSLHSSSLVQAGGAQVSFTDKTLTCRDCGSQFTFTAGEQEFYAQKGFDNEPSRCPNCRRARKMQRNEASGGEHGYGSSSGYSSGSSYSSGGGGYGRSERVQY